MRCPARSSAVSERPERTAQGYRRFRCANCGKQFNERSAGLLNRAQHPSDVIALAVLWRLRYKLSLRDLTETFLIRGFIFSYEAVRDWETIPLHWPSAPKRQCRPKLVCQGDIHSSAWSPSVRCSAKVWRRLFRRARGRTPHFSVRPRQSHFSVPTAVQLRGRVERRSRMAAAWRPPEGLSLTAGSTVAGFGGSTPFLDLESSCPPGKPAENG